MLISFEDRSNEAHSIESNISQISSNIRSKTCIRVRVLINNHDVFLLFQVSV